jgi:hypothetical protein
MTWIELLKFLGPAILQFVGQLFKRQWGQRKQPMKIIKADNALSELKAMRDQLNNTIAKLEGK